MVCHWVGHSKIKPFDVDESFDIEVVIDELESNFNDNDRTESSAVAELIR